ncbi:transglycosylase domain-containing protein [Labedella populi]|uniref:transglycosylase domain-containing protein n=1 Tax=Labedella populi TaxID=2498850 RepID=UPI00140E1674|nr:transglycosylase domain-containing protein [Labedella populi]
MLGGLLGFVGLSAAAGILVTAAVTPALAISGMGASNTIKIFDALPEFLEITPLMEKSTVYAKGADGQPKELAEFYDQNRQEVQWDQISQFYKDAAVAKEDNRYYEHGGVDVIGTTRAIVSTYLLGSEVQGGSSITQQYVKNQLVQRCVNSSESVEEGEKCATAYTTADGSDGVARKLKEMRYAIGLEKKYSKDEILRGYLNIAHFGGITYGVESASQYYFGVSAKDVNLVQAATIMSMVTNPNSLRIDRPDSETNGAANGYEQTKKARDITLQAMKAYGKITAEQYDEAIATPVEPKITQPRTGCEPSGGAAYFCDYVINVIRNSPEFGDSEQERLNLLKRGGLDIYTTLDLGVQQASEQSIYGKVPLQSDSGDVAAAATTIEPGTGRVLAMAQSKKFSNTSTEPGYTSVNFNTTSEYGGSTGFQSGSTYKLFTLVDWLMNGHSVNETVRGTIRNYTLTGSCEGAGGTYKFQNSGNASGRTLSVMSATSSSLNTGFAAMAEKLDLCEIRDVAKSLGMKRADGTELQVNTTSIIGTNEVAPIDVAGSYAAIAANGKYCTPIAIDRIVGPEGDELEAPKSTCTQAIPENVAATAAYALKGVMNGGTGASGNPYDGTQLIGKTGTTDERKHTWLAGASTTAAVALWIGNVEGAVDLRYASVGDYQGDRARFAVWKDIMADIDDLRPGGVFPTPDPNLTKVATRAVPDVSGMSVEEATSRLEASGFGVTVADGEVPSSIGAGLVARTEPGGGGRANYGSTITLYVSSGEGAEVPDIMGDRPDDAQQDLEDAGFTVAVDGSCSEDDARVNSQSPGGDTDAAPGSTVTIGCG